MTRSPMITGVSDNITNRQKNSILSAYAVGKLFTGITKEGLDLDTYVIPGIIRIDNSATNGPVFVTEPKGFLHVNTVNADEDTSPDQEKYIIRQVLYPDNAEFNPQTRVGHGEDIANPVSTVVWSDWAEIGSGGFLNRVELTHSMASNEFAKPNTLYYSYYNRLLRLPDPNSLKKGTRIGLEQLSNKKDNPADPSIYGTVICGTGETAQAQSTSAQYATTYDAEGNKTVSDEVIGSYIYYFTVGAKEENSNEHDWFLETDDGADDPLATVVNTRVTNHINASDPHDQYVLKASLSDATNTASATPKVAASSYAVSKAKSEANTYSDNTFVKKSFLLVGEGADTKVDRNLLPLASQSAAGSVKRLATTADITTGDPDGVITADQLKALSEHIESGKRNTHTGVFVTSTPYEVSELLASSNPYLSMKTGKTIVLPKPTKTMVENTTTVYINLVSEDADATVTVKCIDQDSGLNLEETFTNTKHPNTLILIFEASYDTDANTYTWKLVI